MSRGPSALNIEGVDENGNLELRIEDDGCGCRDCGLAWVEVVVVEVMGVEWRIRWKDCWTEMVLGSARVAGSVGLFMMAIKW